MSELQEHLKQAPRIEHADRPLVFFKIGALGALPLDFPEALAQQYDIPMISSDEIRKDLIEERDRRGLPPKTAQRINLKRIQTIVRDEARESLEDNEDLVIDMFANSPKNRGPIRAIAKDTGAIAVGLWANASYKTITDRVTQWT
jgi:predicted kinase